MQRDYVRWDSNLGERQVDNTLVTKISYVLNAG